MENGKAMKVNFSNTILIIDDTKDVIELFEEWAKIKNIDIKTTSSPEAGFLFLVEIGFRIGAIIMDLSMPTDDGMSFSEKIRKNEAIRGNNNLIPIFWYTSFAMNKSIEAEKEILNIVKIYSKTDITQEELLEKVKKYCRW